MTSASHIAVTIPARRPASWPVFVIKAAALVTVAFVVTEAFWRTVGYMPAGSDMMNFAKLRRAADGDRGAVAMLGSSRVRYGLNPQILDRTVPGFRFLQLGILGNGAPPVLEDLANDPNFQGRIICEFNPAHWGGYPFSSLPEALAFTYPKVSGAYLETLLGEQFRKRTSFFSYNLFTEAPRIFQQKPIPEPERADRFVRFRDLGPKINEPLMNNWVRGAIESGERMKHGGSSRMNREAIRWVEEIRRRGGAVAFVRMPVDGRLRDVENTAFPQTQSLIRELRAGGMMVIDFAEMPGHFRCPDGSHLDASEADRFSQALAEELTAKGFFR
jgi:hypothetical protein